MDFPQPLFDKEQQVLAKAKSVLARLVSEDKPLAQGMAELLDGYEELLGRAKRMTELTLAVQMELEDVEDQVARLTQVDGLTGALNRRTFEKLLARDWARCQREASPISMIIVNLDHFRAYNQIYGSQEGDDCLRAVGGAIMRCLLREVDAAGRLDGDTFVALLPGTEEQGAWIVAERMAKEIAALSIPHLESPQGGLLTVSLGLATMVPGRGDSPMRLISQAQEAMGRAKDQGGSAIVVCPSQVYPEPE